MDDEIEEKLQTKYIDAINIYVKYEDIRKYKIIILFNLNHRDYQLDFIYTYNCRLTLDSNTRIIENMIDEKIKDKLKYKGV